jgi:hypothetical protein
MMTFFLRRFDDDAERAHAAGAGTLIERALCAIATVKAFMKDWELPQEARGYRGGYHFLTFEETLSDMPNYQHEDHELRVISTFYLCVVTGFKTLPPLLFRQPSVQGLERYMSI